jgi:hypothetical protein
MTTSWPNFPSFPLFSRHYSSFRAISSVNSRGGGFAETLYDLQLLQKKYKNKENSSAIFDVEKKSPYLKSYKRNFSKRFIVYFLKDFLLASLRKF